MAEKLAAGSSRPIKKFGSSELEGIEYDDYRDIRFRSELALWRDKSLFNIEFFHPGFLFSYPVKIEELDEGLRRPVVFSPELFSYDGKVGKQIPPRKSLDFVGLRIRYPLHHPDVQDEVGVFLGASYFRFLARDLIYGLSGRGLAVDTAEAGGEEFPYFTRFWLEKPGSKDNQFVVLGLLESASVAGAYRFVVAPGRSTSVEVTMSLFFRTRDKKYGIAPLTSMFYLGENTQGRSRDYRPEIHDSDGLLSHTGGTNEWIWRALNNPRGHVQTTRFSDFNPRGFGLLQRDREFSSYLDTETRYHSRPSMWIEPIGDWGSGSVELVEIPTENEYNDNIVAYWVPKEIREDHLQLRYRIVVDADGPSHRLAKILRTLSANVAEKRAKESFVERRFMIDFGGEELSGLANDQPVTPVLSISDGSFSEEKAEKNPDTGEWRVSYTATRKRDRAADMKVYLSLNGRRISESWTYLWE
jgi:glucans biosynthesis protein